MPVPRNNKKQSAVMWTVWRLFVSCASLLFEIARVLVHFNHVASFIVNANYGIMRTAVELRVADCIIWRVVPQPTKRQRIGKQIDAAFIFARADFVSMHFS